ncbi:MAG TPA: CopD family protein [Pseudonocardia sp.]|nr:CopD family protein [Pseudonocardia sp.]
MRLDARPRSGPPHHRPPGTRPRPGAVWLAVPLAAVAATPLAVWASAPAPVPGVPLPSGPVDYAVPVARVLLDLGLTAVLGLALLPLLFGPSDQRALRGVLRSAYRASLVASVVWLTAALASVVLQTAELAPVPGVTVATLRTYITAFSGAQALLASAGAALLAAALAAAGARSASQLPCRLLVVTVGLGLLPLLATGHSGALSERWHDLTMVSLELHVFAATAWTGGLAAVAGLLLTRPPLLARALPRFSQLAGLCLAVVAVTGVLNALVELATTPGAQLPSVVLTSHYGQLVLAKTGCLAILACCGAHIRFRLLPSVALGRRTALAGWLATELAVMGIAFGLAVVLSRTGVLNTGG